ncbi:MAG: amidohydrolase [Vicinamibacteria bacterium]
MLLLLLLAILAAPALRAAEGPADLVLTGGSVYTMDAARSWADAVAVRGGRIVFVGTEAGARSWIGPATRVVKLEGRMVLPSFQDAHVHPVSGGVELGQCDLHDLPTAEAILEKVGACAREGAGKDWIVGGGWTLSAFPGGAPTKEALDAVTGDKPAYLDSSDGHSAWVNSRALRAGGLAAQTPDPEGGRIDRDPTTRVPTGTLQESATFLVSRHIPPTPLEERLKGLARAQELFHRLGITAVQEADAGAGPAGAGARETLETYREAERRGALDLRVVAALLVEPTRGLEQVDDLVKWRKEFSSPRFKPVAAKIFADGVIETHTASMLEPYLDRPGVRGEPNFTPERLNPLVARLTEAGFNVHVHAIGDRAVRMTLDAFEAARSKQGDRTLRHQIAHLEVIHPDDVPRFRALGVIANFQPLWAYADDYIVDLTWPLLGPERSRWLYPIGSVARSGAVLAFGSDWSVSSPNPLEAIEVALTRQAISEPKRPAMLPEEAIDLPTALAAYTIGSAYAMGDEAETGSLEVGKAADLVVLSANLFAIPPGRIHEQRVLLTLFAGQPVYRSPDLAW